MLTPPCPWWLPPCFAPRCARLGLVLPRGTGLGRALLAPQPLRTYRRWRGFLASPQCVVDKDTFSGPLEDSFCGSPCAPRLRIRVGVFRLGLPSRGASILSQPCLKSKARSLSTQSGMAGEVGPACGYPRVGVVEQPAALLSTLFHNSDAHACHLKARGLLLCCFGVSG